MASDTEADISPLTAALSWHPCQLLHPHQGSLASTAQLMHPAELSGSFSFLCHREAQPRTE